MLAATRIPSDKWQWFGLPGHLVVARDCSHHLCTRVGKYLISTVGHYRPFNKRKPNEMSPIEEIGHNRFFETYIFKIIKGSCECGCGKPNVDLKEIEALSANTDKEADKNHIKMCKKYAEEVA